MRTVRNSSRLQGGMYLVQGVYVVLGGVPGLGSVIGLRVVPGRGDVYLPRYSPPVNRMTDRQV